MLRQYEEGDLDKILIQSKQKAEILDGLNHFIHKDTLVFAEDDVVYAIVKPHFDIGGRVILSALIGQDCKRKAVKMFRIMKKTIDHWLELDNVNRIEFTTQCDFEEATMLALLLGFKCEGRMIKFYNNIDFYLWGRTV